MRKVFAAASSSLSRFPLGCVRGGGVGGRIPRLVVGPCVSFLSCKVMSQGYSSSCAVARDASVDGCNVADLIGNTPLLYLKEVSRLCGCDIFAKAEHMNPFGSVKDRAAKELLRAAEEEGRLRPGGTVIEGTGGNTGVSLALLASVKGYRSVMVMPDKTSVEKQELMKRCGCEVVLCPSTVGFDDKERHFWHVANRMAEETPNSICTNQFENLNNMNAHYNGTGKEIWQQTNGQIDCFVCAAGTGGTISGVSNYLKEVSDGAVTVLVAEPPQAVLYNYVKYGRVEKTEGDKTIAEGIGIDRITGNFAKAKVDDALLITNQELVHMAEFLLKKEGLYVGPSAALNVVGAVKAGRRMLEKRKEEGGSKTPVIVTIICDGGERAEKKLWNPEFLKEKELTMPSREELDSIGLDFILN